MLLCSTTAVQIDKSGYNFYSFVRMAGRRQPAHPASYQQPPAAASPLLFPPAAANYFLFAHHTHLVESEGSHTHHGRNRPPFPILVNRVRMQVLSIPPLYMGHETRSGLPTHRISRPYRWRSWASSSLLTSFSVF